MKAAKLIEILQAGVNQFGDLEVEACLKNYGTTHERHISSTIQFVTTEAYCDGKVFSLRDWK